MDKYKKGQTWLTRRGDKVFILGWFPNYRQDFPFVGVRLEDYTGRLIVSEKELEAIVAMCEQKVPLEWKKTNLITFKQNGQWDGSPNHEYDLFELHEDPSEPHETLIIDNLYA